MVKQRKIDFHYKYYSHLDRSRIKVFIKYTRTLDDAFALAHESKHFMNYTPEKSLQEEIFCETSTILTELRLGEYLKKTSLSEVARLQVKNILYDNYISIEELRGDLKGVRLSDYNHKEVNSRIKYLIGLLLSIYINTNVKKGNISITDYEKIRDQLEQMPLKDLSDILNMGISLDDGILNISDSGLLELEKTYSLQMRCLTRKEDLYYEKCRNCS